MKSTSELTLEVNHLRVSIFTHKGEMKPVNDVSLKIPGGKIIGIVGESGCGKSMTARGIMGLAQDPVRVTGGEVILEGQELLGLSEKERCRIRGSKIAMIFQEPMTSLNPVMKVGRQVDEAIRFHRHVSSGEARKKALEMFRAVDIPEPEQRYNEYPHQFSGGMKQRVMIAIAMICNPGLLIADEPTTALDVTIQAQILRLMLELREHHGTSVIIVTHNMGIIAEYCDDVAVMYMGRVVESGTVRQIFHNPQHPYTRALVRCVPVPGMPKTNDLETISGSTPDASIAFDHCEFEPRCKFATEACRKGFPQAVECEPGHMVSCFARGGQS